MTAELVKPIVARLPPAILGAVVLLIALALIGESIIAVTMFRTGWSFHWSDHHIGFLPPELETASANCVSIRDDTEKLLATVDGMSARSVARTQNLEAKRLEALLNWRGFSGNNSRPDEARSWFALAETLNKDINDEKKGLREKLDQLDSKLEKYRNECTHITAPLAAKTGK